MVIVMDTGGGMEANILELAFGFGHSIKEDSRRIK